MSSGSSSSQTNECGCCEGITKVTPIAIANPPSLSSIGFRVGIQPQFKETMIANLNKYQALVPLTTRSDDDLAIDLLDAWATVADVLTFYQERIANEGFLRTAKERVSVLQLARSIGYELSPGVAASAYLAFTLDTSGSVTQTTINSGTKVQSMPLQGQVPPEMPQTFETIESIVAFPQFNSLHPKLIRAQKLQDIESPNSVDGMNHIYFAGTSTKLNSGDKLLLIPSNATSAPILRTVLSVKLIASLQQTDVTLTADSIQVGDWTQASAPSFIMFDIARFSGLIGKFRPSQPAPKSVNDLGLSDIRRIVSEYPSQSELVAYLAQQGWSYMDFANIVNSFAEELDTDSIDVTDVAVYAMRVKTGIFGNSAPAYNSLPTSETTGLASSGALGPYPINWDSPPAAINTNSQGVLYGGGSTTYLSSSYPAIAQNSWVVFIDKSAGEGGAYRVSDVLDKSIADYMISSKTTGLELDVSTLQPTISSVPSCVASDALLIVEGAGFPPGGDLTFTVDGEPMYVYPWEISLSASITTTVPADEYGCFSVAVFPGSPQVTPSGAITAGTHSIAVTAAGGGSAVTPVSVSPNGNNNPYYDAVYGFQEIEPSGGAGPLPVSITVPANAFNGSDTISIFVDSRYVGSGTSQPDGSFAGQVTIPQLSPGVHIVSLQDSVPDYAYALFSVPGYGTFLSNFTVRGTTVYAQSEELTLAELSYDGPVEGHTIELDSMVAGLQVGQNVAVTGHLNNQPGQTASEIVTITGVVPYKPGFPFTTLTVQSLNQPFQGLINSYVRSTFEINANVALATHGSTVSSEILGGGDPSQPYLTFNLKQDPLTFISSPTSPSGAQTTLQVWVSNGGANLLWNQAPNLYKLSPKSRSYAVRIQDDSSVSVLFGNARPPVGAENITATYRVGIGSSGMVQANQLTLLASRPLGLKSVTNPLASNGAADPENLNDARQNAPLQVLTMGRIVSLTDCENFARSFQGIGKAAAVSAWAGETKYVRLIVASAMEGKVEEPLLGYLQTAITNFADPAVEVSVEPFVRLTFNIAGWIITASDHDSSAVQNNVLAALQAAFSFESMDFGQPVYLSEVIATIQKVDGVIATDVTSLYLTSASAPEANDTLACDIDGLLILNPDPQGVDLEERTP